MKILVTLFMVLVIGVGSSWADPTPTPEPTATPEPTPTPTASPYYSIPSVTTETRIIQTVPSMVLPSSVGRDAVTVEVVAGEGVVCSQTDSEVRADSFRVFETPTPPYRVLDPHEPLYCKSKDGAVAQLVITKNPDKSYTKVIKNLGKTSMVVLQANARRTKSSIIINNSWAPVYCGFTCPINDTNGMLINSIAPTIFRGGEDICCFTNSDDSLTDIAITVEYDTLR